MNVHDVLTQLQRLGTAAPQAAPAFAGRINAHIHLPPNFSAFETVAQAVDLAAAQGIGVLGASNYYDYEIYGDFASLALAKGIYPLFGLEIIAMSQKLRLSGTKVNDPANPGKIYICGKGITRFEQMNPQAQRLLATIRNNDSRRMATMTARLADIFQRHGVDTALDVDAIVDRVVRRHACPRRRVYLQERHLCQAFQERFFELVPAENRPAKLAQIFAAPPKSRPDDAPGIQNEIRTHLLKTGKPAFVEESFLPLEEAYRLICALGGIPCYPVLADGQNPISNFEAPVERLIDNLRAAGIWMAEFIPTRNTPATIEKYVPALRAAGFAVTAGTEHNTLDMQPLEPRCLKANAVPPAIMAIFREGACVAAAHQQLVLNGQCGFVDDRGQLNPRFSTSDQRIKELSLIGAATIAHVQPSSLSLVLRGEG